MNARQFVLAALALMAPLAAWSFDLKDVSAAGNDQVRVRALPSGMVIYTFDIDAQGRSNCKGDCAEKWPPVLLSPSEAAALADSSLGVHARANGLLQLTVEGRPVYTFYLDRTPGDVLGDGVGGVWHVIPGAP